MAEIEVVYNDGMFGFVDPQELTRLIETGAIVKFMRGSSWVYLGVDPVRTGVSRNVAWDKRRPESGI